MAEWVGLVELAFVTDKMAVAVEVGSRSIPTSTKVDGVGEQTARQSPPPTNEKILPYLLAKKWKRISPSYEVDMEDEEHSRGRGIA